MFRIGEFSRLTQVTVKALRHYDSLGLLKPAQIDEITGYRYYSSAQLPRLHRILALKDLGLSLEQIGKFIDSDLSPTQLRALLLVKQAEARDAIASEQERLARIEARLRQIESGALPDYDVVVRRIEATRVASIRRTLPNRSAIGDLFRQLVSSLQRNGIHSTDPTVIWHDPDFHETDVDAEATFAISDPLPAEAKVQVRELPAIDTMACVAYSGPITEIGQACWAVLDWIEAHGYEVAGPERVRSIERSSSHQGPTVAELQYPVTKVQANSSPCRRSD